MKIAKAYSDFMKDTERLILLYGGAGSGKSVSAQQKVLVRLMSEENHKFLTIRKVAKTLKTSVFDLFVKIIKDENLDDDFIITQVPMEITYKKNGNKIIFAGFDFESKEKIKSISGITGIFIEEATELDEVDYIQLNLRLRGKTTNYKQIIMCFNPIDMRSWIYKSFFKEKKYTASIYHTTYKDNPFLDDEYRKQLEDLSSQNELYYKVYNKGEWASLSETTVFTDWEISNLEYDMSKYKNVTVGVDFGFSHASVALVVGHTEKELVILKEIHHKELTNAEFIEKIKKGIPDWKDLIFYLDSAEPDRIKEFKNSGFAAIGVKKGKGSVGFAIDHLLRKPILVDESCKNTIIELSDFKYLKDDRMDVIYPDKFENDGLYDCLAALRYSQNSLIRKKDSKLKAVPSL